jgi:hypothetical protein
MNEHQIDLESPMKRAFDQGVDAYAPVFRGEALEVEACIPEVSLNNLRRILKGGLKVSALHAGKNSHTLVVFSTGETYLATGFNVGYPGDLACLMLAQFASEAGLGSMQAWKEYLGFLPPEFHGLLDPRVPTGCEPEGRRLKTFTGE